MGYVGAPYNFIEMNQKVYEKNEIQPHNVIEPQKHTGEIEYEVEAITPVVVDNGNGEFYKNVNGKMAIPGSTMRGLVRNNMQILSFSSFADDIQDGRFMYRNVTKGKEQERYNKILGSGTDNYTRADGTQGRTSVLRNVKAGYIRNNGGKYCILHNVVDSKISKNMKMDYYVINERKIIESMDKNFNFMLYHKPYIMQNNIGPFKEWTDRNGDKHYKGDERREYHPDAIEISYKLSGTNKIIAVDKKDKLSHKGYLVLTGKMSEKKAIYIIPEIDEKSDIISIPQSDIDDFKRDYESRKNQLRNDEKGFFSLPQAGETKPVFYIQLDGKIYFGFTPRLRLFYDKTIYDGITDKQKNTARDYCKSIFGYSSEKESYKSRVSFTDAISDSKGEPQGEISLILGSPKPTSYLDYLTSDKDEAVSYNDKFKLRGVKQYWLKNKEDEGGEIKNFKAASVIKPFAAGTNFKGKIRFENLSDNELGMLLWSLLLEKQSNQNIGKAKPYGYGRIAISLSSIKLLDFDKMYGNNGLSIKPYKDKIDNPENYIQCAKDDMSSFLRRDIMTMPRIKNFFLMKDTTKIPSKEKTRYMSFNHIEPTGEKCNEYQDRVKKLQKLPTVSDVIEGKPLQYTKSNNKTVRQNKGNNGKRW